MIRNSVYDITTLTEESPNSALWYTQKMTFWNQKFNQVCPKIAKFGTFFGLEILKKSALYG